MEYIIGAAALLIFASAILILQGRDRPGPRLVSTLLPPYDIPEVILVSGVLVENRGDETARNVKIEISCDRGDTVRIKHLQVASDEPYALRGGGAQFSFATIRLRGLRPGKKLFVYWAAGEQFQPSVTITRFHPGEEQPRGGRPLDALRQRLRI